MCVADCHIPYVSHRRFGKFPETQLPIGQSRSRDERAGLRGESPEMTRMTQLPPRWDDIVAAA